MYLKVHICFPSCQTFCILIEAEGMEADGMTQGKATTSEGHKKTRHRTRRVQSENGTFRRNQNKTSNVQTPKQSRLPYKGFQNIKPKIRQHGDLQFLDYKHI